MNFIVWIESLLHALDVGALIESLRNYRKRTWNIDPTEIIKQMLIGKGRLDLTPPQLSRMITHQEAGLHLIDLRESHKYREKHITHAVSKPIDNFLKEIYEGKYPLAPPLQKIILVCDTGQLSKFAASLMTEEGFTRVYSLKGGMRRWNRWEGMARKAFFARFEKIRAFGEVKCC